jgi:hypothetical protein
MSWVFQHRLEPFRAVRHHRGQGEVKERWTRAVLSVARV